MRPGYCHYYFGDYYGVEYDWLGIYPWFDMGQYPDFAYDPLFTYYRSYHRDRDPQWQANLKGWHHHYRSHPDERPPHDMAAQTRLVAAGGTRPDRDFLRIGLAVDALCSNPLCSIKVVDVSAAEQARFHETARSTRQLETERSRLESQAAGGHGKGPHSLALPRVSQGMAAAACGRSRRRRREELYARKVLCGCHEASEDRYLPEAPRKNAPAAAARWRR